MQKILKKLKKAQNKCGKERIKLFEAKIRKKIIKNKETTN